MVGVAMTWYSEMIEVSRSALLVSVVCIVLNAVRVVINSEMLTGESKVKKTGLFISPGLHVEYTQSSGEKISVPACS